MRKIFCVSGALVLSIGLISCGGGGDTMVTPPPPPVCAANTFCMGGSSFFVNGGGITLSIPANTAVTWTNDSGTEHNVTFDDESAALAVGTGGAGTFTAPNGSTNQRKFAVSGTSHTFHCTLHPGMAGTVTVQ